MAVIFMSSLNPVYRKPFIRLQFPISLHFTGNSLRLVDSHVLVLTTKIHRGFFFSLPTLELIASIEPPLADLSRGLLFVLVP